MTQATIHRTICVDGWTDTVRPPENISEQEKEASLAAYSAPGSLGDYEYDHFVPLELGGATNDPRNLWPEPGNSPNPKDAVEDELRQEVCDGRISLTQAQREIVANWTAYVPRRTAPSSPATARRPNPSAECSVSASYSSTYHDYDVYVRSNQPDQTVTVTSSAGASAAWHSDSSGYADVYFHVGASAAGERITARVGLATCYGTL